MVKGNLSKNNLININNRTKGMSDKRFSVHFQRFEHLGFTSTDAGGRKSTSASAEHYRDETQTERGLQGLAPKIERISLCSVNVYGRYSSRLDLWWKSRQTWHSWYWTAVQSWRASKVLMWDCVPSSYSRTCSLPKRNTASGTRLLYTGPRRDEWEKGSLCDGTTATAETHSASYSQSFTK